MKVAFAFMSMPVGGAEDFALTISRQPRFAGETEFQFVCLRELGVLGGEFAREGGRVECLPAAKSRRFSLPGVLRFARWLREQGIDLLHSQTYHAHTYAVPAAWLAGIPVVLHQQKTLEKMKWRRALAFGMLARRADGMIALSKRTAEEIHRGFGIPHERLFVLPNLVDETLFTPVDAAERRQLRVGLGLPPDRFLIGTVASLNAVKNHPATLAVAKGLRDSGLEAAVWIFGEGKERSALEAAIAAEALGEHITLAGNRRPIHPWVQALDLFVLPSHWEGQSLALLQAVACGIPVVASAIEGNLAVLGADHPGLFPAGGTAAYLQVCRH
ncbi:MAG TPA: glycosyltransferase, partial [Chthoniobacterales bacterium]